MSMPSPNDPFALLGEALNRKSKKPDIDGYKPQEYQIDYHTSRKKGRIVFGGNRSGKTYSSVAEMVWWATGTHPYRPTPRPPLALRHVCVDKPQGTDKILKELYRQLVPPRYLRGRDFDKAWEEKPDVLWFSNGSFIEFLTYEQTLSKHAGTSRHAVGFDEEPDEAIFNENMARLVDTDGEWWISLTPLEGLTWLYHRFYLPWEQGTLSDDIEMWHFLTKDNQYIKLSAVERLLGDLSAEEREARLTGRFMALSGLIYPFNERIHVAQCDPQPHWLTFTSMDHGLRNPTSWHWYQIDQDGRFYVVREHYAAEMLVPAHARVVTQTEAANRLLTPEYRVGDPSIWNRQPNDGQSVGSEYAQHGVHIGPGNNNIEAGINRVAALFEVGASGEPRIIIDPTCRNLIREARTYRWASYATRKAEMANEPKAKPEKRNDHSLDDLRYAAMTRPAFDRGNGVVDLSVPYKDPHIRLAPSLSSSDDDYRNRIAFDDTLGSEF